MSDSEFATPRPRAVEPRPLSPRVTSLTPESIVRLLSDLRLGTHDPYVHDVVVSESLSVDQPASADLADVQSPSDVTASSLHVVSHSSSETKAAPSSGISASVFDTFNNATIPGSTIDAGTESQAGESVVWSEDLASSTIESFLTNSELYVSGGDPNLSKLQLWQSLCIEFGLVEVPDGSVNFDRPISPVLSEASGTTQRPSLARVNGNVCGKSYHMFPTSLTQAKQLLELHAHVNLVDYMELRKELQLARGQEDVGRIRAEIKALNLRSAKSLRRYTYYSGKFISREVAKKAWLNPLLTTL